MPFRIIRNDIVNMRVDAIVNTANPQPLIGDGTDSRIHQAAGPELLEARQRIGRISRGCAAITPAFGLKARYVIHTVGPVFLSGAFGEDTLLRSCYDSALRLALENGCQSIAFPLISTGFYGFPKDRALKIAIAAFTDFLAEHEMEITLVVYDREAYRLSERLFRGVENYLDENYTEAAAQVHRKSSRILSNCRYEDVWDSAIAAETAECRPMPSCAPTLEELLKQEDAGFTETLLRLIDEKGWKDSQVYKKANLSKQHFSKIRNDPHYRPKKATALALAIALELDLEATRDLIGRAGYALTNSSRFDLIVRYFIENRKYNIVEINFALFEHDQSLLGA